MKYVKKIIYKNKKITIVPYSEKFAEEKAIAP